MVGSWEHLLKLHAHKPGTLAKILKHNRPKKRKYGKGARKCIICGRHNGLIRKYGIMMCRECFKRYAEQMGWFRYGE